MRITNRIITNNSLANINRVKGSKDDLNTQLATGKKISRPSDDPVVAIRALRLRANASKVEQYYEKNTEDAEAWLEVTDSAIHNVSAILTEMLGKCETGASDTVDTDARLVLVEALQSLSDEVYSTGDTDYGGRYVFTGYRTESTLTFQDATQLQYSITEQLSKANIETINHVYADDLMNFTKTNYDNLNVTEQDVETRSIYRIQLAYQDSDPVAPTISYLDPAGNTVEITANVTSLKMGDPYMNVAANGVNFIPETGELILGQSVASALNNTLDDPLTPLNEGEIKVTYEKSSWAKADLKPEHYFACTTTDANGKTIDYNQELLDGQLPQIIEYTTGTGQSLRINTLANEVFTHNISRSVDELAVATEQLEAMDGIVDTLTEMIEEGGLTGFRLTEAQDKLAAAKKAQALQEDAVQKLFASTITKMQDYIEQTSLASTNCGSRASRLVLIQNRLADQQTTIDNLVSENEDCDETTVAVELKAAEVTYEAALLATSKITQTSLLNYL